MKKFVAGSFFLILLTLFVPHIVSAHEVYVLTPAQITDAVHMPPFNMLAVAEQNLGQFTFWAFISTLVVFIVFFSSISRWLEKKFDPFFTRIKKYAPAIARVTVGVSFLAAAYYQASYGPELPLAPAYGIFTPAVTAVPLLSVFLLFSIYGLDGRHSSHFVFLVTRFIETAGICSHIRIIWGK